ncbi:MAG TPA: ABC transporter substrate-binding protein [Rikenellaceae bacterium]|nr:ABC transporter substrate-binding protein [Rikenellaceae bacterium]
MKKRILIVFISFSTLSLFAGKDNRIVFCPHWIPQAQFAGFYAALDKGFYRDAGLDVEIIHPSANVASFKYLESKKADIVSSFLMDAIKVRAGGLPVVNILQLSQHSALMFVARKKDGITELAHLEGKKIGIWNSGFDDIPIALMKEKGYSFELVRILSTINLFMTKGIDVLAVMYYNEYDQIINSGINYEELSTFFMSDYGYDIPEDGLYCMKQDLEEREEYFLRFTKATLKGWDYVRENKDYAIDLVVEYMNRANLPSNKTHQRWMLDKVLELLKPGDKSVQTGKLLPEDFYKAIDIIMTGNSGAFINENFSFEEFHKPLVSQFK